MVFSQSTWKIQFTNLRAFTCSKSKLETPEQGVKSSKINKSNQRQCRRSGVFIVNFKHILKFLLVFLLLPLSRPRPIEVFLLLAFLLYLNRYFCSRPAKTIEIYRNRLSYPFLFSLLKERSCLWLIILTTRYYVAFSISLPVTRCAGHNTDLTSNSNIS